MRTTGGITMNVLLVITEVDQCLRITAEMSPAYKTLMEQTLTSELPIDSTIECASLQCVFKTKSGGVIRCKQV